MELDEHILSIPLVDKNRESVCLPLVVDAIALYWGEQISETDVLKKSKEYENIKGTIMVEGLNLAERYDLKSYIYNGSLSDLKKRIQQGIPVIVILPGIYDVLQHAVIIAGYNDAERRIITYIPEPDTFGAIPEDRFLQEWEQENMLSIIIFPKDMEETISKDTLKHQKSNRLCYEAEKLRFQNRLDDCIALLDKTVNMENDNPLGWYLLGLVYNEANSEKAIECYKKAIDYNPKYFLAYRGLGNYYLKKADFTMADANYSKAISIHPNRFGPIYKNRAIAKMNLRNNSEAKNDLELYLEKTPNASDRSSILALLKELS